ncbi:hypothetical protein ACRQ5D_31320 [Mucilaginibacter sp. P25]|uniref:Uncharacterized protein n=1 Tax=Mucilaginibacter gossypiicola TaxID=551995 RepID=A0A1H8AUT5_9SPHI|nr:MULTISPECIES: hypothetical protein [Mucilaginibacter]UOE52242.1 hypothetical protein MTO98_14250 [Mucilaginibacter sp. SMC90]SEM74480.1 hypothetical protein SAMN05192574_101674 [Mucilaginibacter gossypiicola]
MLNNKKSFLQKARIAMVAIVTIMSVGGAYAMNAPKHQAGTTWGVVATTANSYQVTALTANSHCNSGSTVCEIQTELQPNASKMIPKSPTQVTEIEGTFVR